MRVRRALVVVSWLVGLSAAAAVLVVTGRGALAGPDVMHPSTWATWARGRDPVDAAVAIVRTGVLGVTLYLLLVTVLGLVARVAALPRLVAGLDIAGGPLVRRVLTGAAGAGLALSTLAPGAAMAAPGAPPASSSPPPTAVMRLLDERSSTTTVAPPATASPVVPPATPPPAPPAARDSVYRVRPGDSFWSIAERRVAGELGRTPTDREVGRYWRTLIDANRDRLVVPGEPDLIHPGQQFRLP